MSHGKGEGRLSQLPSTLAKLAQTGSVQNAKQSLEEKKYPAYLSKILNKCSNCDAEQVVHRSVAQNWLCHIAARTTVNIIANTHFSPYSVLHTCAGKKS